MLTLVLIVIGIAAGGGGTATDDYPATYGASPTAVAPPSPSVAGPAITGSSTYTEGEMVYLQVRYRDDGSAVGFGFRGVGSSSWGEESHLFSDPSYGQVSSGQVAYPFNHGCGTGQDTETDLEFWIYDASGDRDSTTAHLACSE